MARSKREAPIESEVHRGVALTGTVNQQGSLVRLLTDWNFAKRAMRYALHLPTPMETEDRRVLEQIIFKYYAAQTEFQKILSQVQCREDWLLTLGCMACWMPV